MDYWHRNWACPFFRWDDKKRVCCENGTSLSFPDREAATEYFDRYCASVERYRHCTVASMLLRFYERSEENGKDGTARPGA